MTYHEIVTLITSRIGWSGLSGGLKNNLRMAISISESELIQDTNTSFTTVVLNINQSKADYHLTNDFGITNFNAPYEIVVYSTDDIKLAHEEVTYGKWLSWDPSQSSAFSSNDQLPADRNFVNPDALIDSARFSGKVLVSIHHEGGDAADVGYILSIKPAIDGKVVLSYSTLPNSDIFEDLSREPSLPQKFHHYIVAGAVFRMAQIMAGDALAKGDLNTAKIYQDMEARAYSEFRVGVNSVLSNKNTMDRPVVAKPFMFYNDTSRRSGRRY